MVSRISYINSRNTLTKKIVNEQTALNSINHSNYQTDSTISWHENLTFITFPFRMTFQIHIHFPKSSSLSKSPSPHPNLNWFSKKNHPAVAWLLGCLQFNKIGPVWRTPRIVTLPSDLAFPLPHDGCRRWLLAFRKMVGPMVSLRMKQTPKFLLC